MSFPHILESWSLSWRSPALSTFLQKGDASTLWSSLWLSRSTSTVPHPSCFKGCRPGHRGLKRAEHRETVPFLPCCHPCFDTARTLLAFRLQVHTAASCWVLPLRGHWNLPPQGCSQWTLIPVCPHIWDCSDLCATPCAWPRWTSLHSWEPTVQCVKKKKENSNWACNLKQRESGQICVAFRLPDWPMNSPGPWKRCSAAFKEN